MDKMSVFEQFQHLLTRRTLYKVSNSSKQHNALPSTTLLNFNSLSNTIYNSINATRFNQSPKRGKMEKYQDIKRRLTSRGAERPKKIIRYSKSKNNNQQDQSSSENSQLTSNTLFCTKAVVHIDQKNQQTKWRYNFKSNQKVIQKKAPLQNEIETTSYLRPARRLSQQIQVSQQAKKFNFFSQNQIRIKTVRKMSETNSSFAFDTQSKKIQNCLNFMKTSPIKKQCNQSEVTKATKCEDDLSCGQIEAWSCEQGFVDDLQL